MVLVVGAIYFSGCAKSSNTSGDGGVAGAGGVCVPEKDLLVSGIVGGNVVQSSASDSKNAIMILSDKNQLCTSTALSRTVLLTAAHCLSDASKAVALTSSTLSCESGFDVTVNQIKARKLVVHEDYSSDISAGDSANDVALVFLEKPLPSSYPIFSIADLTTLTKENSLYLWGFGEINNNSGGDGQLRKTQISADDYSINNDMKKVVIDQSSGHGICHGDSGGAAFVKQDGQLKILGVNSYVVGPEGSGLCNGKAYLTLATEYQAWIQKQIYLNK